MKEPMRKYLSMGFGVNSVALYLLLLEQGLSPGDPVNGFEAVFVNHGNDWPETYEYAKMFMQKYPVSVILPEVRDNQGNTYNVLYDYYAAKQVIPVKMSRSCTDRFKIRPMQKYMISPCFVLLGIDNDESHRAKPSHHKGFESRWPLLEEDPPIGREDCKNLIIRHGLPVPSKSGCWICPFQPRREWKRLRSEYPELFCKAKKLEDSYAKRRRSEGKLPLWLAESGPLHQITGENNLLPGLGLEYPPCQCSL